MISADARRLAEIHRAQCPRYNGNNQVRKNLIYLPRIARTLRQVEVGLPTHFIQYPSCARLNHRLNIHYMLMRITNCTLS
jgi:hypothetical protein